jgi:hypothetical protein
MADVQFHGRAWSRTAQQRDLGACAVQGQLAAR